VVAHHLHHHCRHPIQGMEARMTSTASTDWPRAYLFQIHAEAITHGLVFIEAIDKKSAISLRQRLYRIRRRSDKANAVFIPPEYHLVTCGQWEELPPSHPAYPGRLPIIYNRLPGGKELPRIRPAEAHEASLAMMPTEPLGPLPLLSQDALLENITAIDLTLKPDEVDSFVEDLMRQAEARGEDNEDDGGDGK
jgi:hypothetical protein